MVCTFALFLRDLLSKPMTPMKNTADIIRELAAVYGIEVSENPSGHVAVNDHGVEFPLTQNDYASVFGLPVPEGAFADIDLQSLKSLKHIANSMPLGRLLQKQFQATFNEPDCPDGLGPAGNTKYAMAA